MADLFEALTLAVKETRKAKEDAEEISKNAGKAVKVAEAKLAEEMANQGLKSVRTQHGQFIFSGMKEYWSFREETKDQAMAIIRTIAEQLVKEQVNVKSLGAWLKEERSLATEKAKAEGSVEVASFLDPKVQTLISILGHYEEPSIRVCQ